MQDRELAWEAGLDNMTAAVRAEYVSLTPLGRTEDPEDVADVAVFRQRPGALHDGRGRVRDG